MTCLSAMRRWMPTALLSGLAALATLPVPAQDEGGGVVTRGAMLQRQTFDGEALASGEDGLVAGADTRRALALEVYNNGRALVSETRQLPLLAGVNRLKLTAVATALVEDSVRLTGPQGVTVQTQSYDPGPPGYQQLLQAHVGRPVTLVRESPVTGEQITTQGRLLGLSEGRAMVRLDGRIEVAGPDFPWRITFEGPGEAEYWQPGVRALVSAEASQGVDVALSYLTEGLGWRADYDLVLAGDGRAALSGWASVSNASGADFANARLGLIAGDVAAGRPAQPLARSAAMESTADVQREAVGGAYHRYVIPGRVSIADGQTRQLPLLELTGLTVERSYRVSHQARPRARTQAEPQPVSTRLTLQPAGREAPLPAGVVRVYQRGGDGQLRWLGEDRIGHTPAGAALELTIGRAFDVQAQRRQTAYERLGERSFEAAWEIELTNASDQSVPVFVEEQLSGDWAVQEASPSPAARDAQRLEWRVSVDAGGSATVRYRVRVAY